MKKVGEVALILNDKFAVIKTTESLILGSDILVYKEVGLTAEEKSKSGLPDIKIPKGKLKVLMLQANNVYLVSVITKRASDNSTENQNLARSLSLYNTIFGKGTQEVDSAAGEPAPYSAKLDTSKATKIEFNHLVVPGDTIGFEQGSIPANTTAQPQVVSQTSSSTSTPASGEQKPANSSEKATVPAQQSTGTSNNNSTSTNK